MPVGCKAFCAVGIVGYGGCGFTFAMQAKAQKGDWGFYPGLVMTILYIMQGAVFIWTLFKLYKLMKQDKASLRKAQMELLAEQV